MFTLARVDFDGVVIKRLWKPLAATLDRDPAEDNARVAARRSSVEGSIFRRRKELKEM